MKKEKALHQRCRDERTCYHSALRTFLRTPPQEADKCIAKRRGICLLRRYNGRFRRRLLGFYEAVGRRSLQNELPFLTCCCLAPADNSLEALGNILFFAQALLFLDDTYFSMRIGFCQGIFLTDNSEIFFLVFEHFHKM